MKFEISQEPIDVIPIGFKICSICGEQKPDKDFGFRKNGSARRRSYCRECGKKKFRSGGKL